MGMHLLLLLNILLINVHAVKLISLHKSSVGFTSEYNIFEYWAARLHDISMWYRLTLTKRQRKPKGQSRMDKPEKLATPSTQDIGRGQTKKKHNTEIKTRSNTDPTKTLLSDTFDPAWYISPHSDTLSGFEANQSSLFLLMLRA